MDGLVSDLVMAFHKRIQPVSSVVIVVASASGSKIPAMSFLDISPVQLRTSKGGNQIGMVCRLLAITVASR